MIEKLARYLCECDEVNPDATLSGDGVNFLWESYAVRVKEMLKIMREPTDEMIVAMENAEPQLECFLEKEKSPAYLVWKAAIDKILGT